MALRPPTPSLRPLPPIASPSPGFARSAAIVLRIRNRSLLLDRAPRSVAGQIDADQRLHLIDDSGDPPVAAAVPDRRAAELIEAIPA